MGIFGNPGDAILQAYWTMDEELGTRYNRTASPLDLTNVGGGLNAENGMRARCANFVASFPRYLWKPNDLWLNIDNQVVGFEMGCWVRLHSTGATQRIMGKWTTGGKEYLLYYYAPGNRFYFILYDGTSNFSVAANTFGAISANTWYYVHGYFSVLLPYGEGVGIGVNDVWDKIQGPLSTVYTGYNGIFTMGIDSDLVTEPMNGFLDEATWWGDGLLTASNRTWLYNSGYGRSFFDISETKPPTNVIQSPGPTDPVPVHILDSNLEYVGIIEDYYSLVWAERYNEIGDFELELPISYYDDPNIAFGNFLYIKSSDSLMIIEDIKPVYAQDKDTLSLEGSSAESILKRRVVDAIHTVDGPGEISIYDLVFDHITMPLDEKLGTDRVMDLFNPDYPEMLSIPTYEEQFDVQSLYDIIVTICKNSVDAKYKGLGFKIVNDGNNKLMFYVYNGADRSYNQIGNPGDPTTPDYNYVVFADKFNNVKTSSVFQSVKENATVVLVLSEDVTYPSVYVWADGTSAGPIGNEPTGMDRIEKVIETDIDRDATDPVLTDAEVLAIITTRGRELIITGTPALFEGDFEIQGTFVYGTDFFVGDIVQCILAGRDVPARIVELVRSYSAEGRTAYIAMDFNILV